MNPNHNLLDLLDPKKTTSPITSLPKLSFETFSAISKAPTCSTKSSESPENMFMTINHESKAKPQTHSKPRTGDWLCLLCGNHNYSFRETCNRCQKQTKTCNFEQSLRIFNDSNLKNNMMKNEAMSKRLKFNFCYSLGSRKPNQTTLNANIISPNFTQRMSMMNSQYLSVSDFYKGHNMQYQPNFLSANQIPRSNRFQHQSDFQSKFSDFPQVNEISPMFSFGQNQGLQNFNKGTIKSDICHDKYMSQINQENMQQNLVEKFKKMNLISENKQEKPFSNNKMKGQFENRKKQKNKLKYNKENQRPPNTKGKKQKLKQKRRGKIKYKAVESSKMKKNKGVFKATIHSQKIENKPIQPVNSTKSVEELFQTEFTLQRDIFQEPEEVSRKYQDEEDNKSPNKMNLESIFHSKLLFDFETPKKARNDCFLHGDSIGKDSDFKYDYGFSKQKNKILRLFSQSDDEDEEIMGDKEFSQSIQKMKQTGFGDRVF